MLGKEIFGRVAASGGIKKTSRPGSSLDQGTIRVVAPFSREASKKVESSTDY